MKLWHVDILPYLPKTQLKDLWKLLNKMYTSQLKDIHINYAYYDHRSFYKYSLCVIEELYAHNIKISLDNFNKYFDDVWNEYDILQTTVHNYRTHILNPFYIQHDDEFLGICYFDLKEQYMYSQKDFTRQEWENLNKHIKFVALREQRL